MATNQNQQLAQRVPFSALIATPAYQKTIANTLRDPAQAKRFCAAIVSAVSVNPTLQECDPPTILSGALLGESLNLSPSPQLGQYYLVPFDCQLKDENGKPVYLYDENGNHLTDYRGKWQVATVKKAQFVLGYKGYIQLAVRSGYYKRINVMEIKEGELVRWDPLYEDATLEIFYDEEVRNSKPTSGYLASFEYLNGFQKTIYWSKSKMEQHALKYSKGYAAKKGYTFWEKEFDAMAKKTMLRQLISKWGIMSVDLQKAFEEDHTLDEISPEEVLEPAAPPAEPAERIEAPAESVADPAQQQGAPAQVSLDDL